MSPKRSARRSATSMPSSPNSDTTSRSPCTRGAAASTSPTRGSTNAGRRNRCNRRGHAIAGGGDMPRDPRRGVGTTCARRACHWRFRRGNSAVHRRRRVQRRGRAAARAHDGPRRCARPVRRRSAKFSHRTFGTEVEAVFTDDAGQTIVVTRHWATVDGQPVHGIQALLLTIDSNQIRRIDAFSPSGCAPSGIWD